MGDVIDMRSFKPSDNLKNYRNALGRFATGIAVVTAIGPEDGPTAITINSFASVSLNPALILWSPDKNSRRHDTFVNAEHFVVHVLAAEQRYICDGFVKSAYAFDDVPHLYNEYGVPVIEDCLAVFQCRQYATHDAGDHTIVLGEVHRASHRPGEALVFANGAFREIPVTQQA